jgi:putative transposase
MARQTRLTIPVVALHIVQRGNNRAPCFRVESDFLLYLAHLRDLTQKLECAVHAYCLMSNHVHLLLTPGSHGACSDLMKNLGQRYAQYFNSRYGRTGTLWEGRFRSCVAESAHYVLACYRYIELNPVRAGMVSHPSAWLWSSFAVNSGIRTDPLVSPHSEYTALGNDEQARNSNYQNLFAGEFDPSLLAAIRDATSGGYPLATDSFKDNLVQVARRKLQPGRAGRPAKKIGV